MANTGNPRLSKLKLPGADSPIYEIDAMYLNGRTLDEILSSTMSFKGTVTIPGNDATVKLETIDGGKTYFMPTGSYVPGDAYKVILSGSTTVKMHEADSASAQLEQEISHGDMIIYSASSKWVLIPSGNDEQVGTVTAVTAGTGLLGGTISDQGTISVDTSYVSTVGHTHSYSTKSNITDTNTSVTIDKFNVSANYTPAGNVTVNVGSGVSGTEYVPAGSVGASFEGTEIDNAKVSFTPNVTPTSTTFTPAGTVTQPTFTGSEGNVEVSGTAAGSLSNLAFAGTDATITIKGVVTNTTITGASYTPSGSVKVTADIDTTTETVVKDITVTNGTAPSVSSWGSLTGTHDASTQTLTLNFGAGSFNPGTHTTVTKSTQDVIASVTSNETDGTFTGSAATITPTLNVTKPEAGVSTSYTPTGTVSGNFVGGVTTLSGTFTPAGTVSQPTFISTQKQAIVTSVTAGAQTETVSAFTPAGTVTAGFTGTATKIGATFSGTAGTATQNNIVPSAHIQGTINVSGTTESDK